MDNLFIIQPEYLDTHNGYIVKSLLDKYAGWTLDRYSIGETEKKSRERIVPVGNLLFVQEYLNKKMKPIEVPEELRKFLGREYHIMQGKDIPKEYLNDKYFFKDADTLKLWNNAVNPYDLDIKPEIKYVVSERVYFESEYRVFVHNGEVFAAQNYLGDPLIFPDAEYIKEIVGEYLGPKAYTLDIGMHKKNGKLITDIIEVHAFVSCGLYGWYDKEIIPMLSDGFAWYETK